MGVKDVALSLKLQYPKSYISFSRGFTSSHRGVDMAWNSNYGGANAPIFAPADGEVVAVVNNKGNTWKSGVADWGNLVKIKHATNIYTLSAHMQKGSIVVKVGDKVKRGQFLGNQNNSGYSNGSHDHFEVYVGGAGTGYRVNPVEYCFAYPDQVVNADTQKTYGIKHYDPITYVGTPVARNSLVDQVKVISETLRARKTPGTSGEILGYVRTGIYNVKGTTTANGYTWFNVEDFWIAQDAAKTWCEFMPKTVPHYNGIVKNMDPDQKASFEAWCKAQKVSYTINEV